MADSTRPRVPIALGSASTGTEEGRSFLQSRIALFGGWVFTISGAFYLVGAFVRLLIGPPLGFDQPFVDPNMFHLVATLAAGAVWAVARFARLTTPGLLQLDAAGTFVVCGFFGLMAGAFAMGHIEGYGDPNHALFIGLLACSYTLISRAISVPCTSTRTVWISSLAMLPILIAGSVALHANVSGVPLVSGLVDLVSWVAAAVAMAAISSRVIFGLRAEVARIRKLGQYTLEARLGEGGMGIVYRARHALLRRPTAIKILPPSRSSEDDVRRFEREVQLTATLSHPSTVVIFDYGRTPDGVFYYAMELLEGLNLEQLVARDGPQPPGRVIHVLYQVAGALAEAHDVGLIHRDIKPANIILSERGGLPDVAKVVDFGLVKHFDPLTADTSVGVTAANVIVGTPLYMSPEAITHAGTAAGLDGRSDLYSLGAVAYFLLTGKPVFEARNVVEICSHHLHTPPVPPSQRSGRPIPAELENTVLRCLAKDRADRFPSARALQDALAAAARVTPWSHGMALDWWKKYKEGHATAPVAVPASVYEQVTSTLDGGKPFANLS